MKRKTSKCACGLFSTLLGSSWWGHTKFTPKEVNSADFVCISPLPLLIWRLEFQNNLGCCLALVVSFYVQMHLKNKWTAKAFLGRCLALPWRHSQPTLACWYLILSCLPTLALLLQILGTAMMSRVTSTCNMWRRDEFLASAPSLPDFGSFEHLGIETACQSSLCVSLLFK